MTIKSSSSHNIALREKASLLFLLSFILITKVFFLMHANPLPDEAYYWLWSKNLSLSYFDHPPLAYWSQALIFFFSSNKYFVIRALPVLSLVTVLTIMIFWLRHMHERIDFGLCLKSIVLFLAFPIYSIFFSISFPDHLLITLLFGSSFCFFLYFKRDKKASGGMHYWYLAVLLFSLST